MNRGELRLMTELRNLKRWCSEGERGEVTFASFRRFPSQHCTSLFGGQVKEQESTHKQLKTLDRTPSANHPTASCSLLVGRGRERREERGGGARGLKPVAYKRTHIDTGVKREGREGERDISGWRGVPLTISFNNHQVFGRIHFFQICWHLPGHKNVKQRASVSVKPSSCGEGQGGCGSVMKSEEATWGNVVVCTKLRC